MISGFIIQIHVGPDVLDLTYLRDSFEFDQDMLADTGYTIEVVAGGAGDLQTFILIDD